jgi:hypothetical protein
MPWAPAGAIRGRLAGGATTDQRSSSGGPGDTNRRPNRGGSGERGDRQCGGDDSDQHSLAHYDTKSVVWCRIYLRLSDSWYIEILISDLKLGLREFRHFWLLIIERVEEFYIKAELFLGVEAEGSDVWDKEWLL